MTRKNDDGRRPGAWFFIPPEKLSEIAHAAAVDESDALRLLIGYDWPNAQEHQAWLGEAPIEEIATWLRKRLDDETGD